MLRLLLPEFLSWRPRFTARVAHVEHVGDQVALVEAYLRAIQYPLPILIPRFPRIICHHRWVPYVHFGQKTSIDALPPNAFNKQRAKAFIKYQ